MMQIEHLALDALIPYARNARTHSDEQTAQIAMNFELVRGGFPPIAAGGDFAKELRRRRELFFLQGDCNPLIELVATLAAADQ